MLFEKRIEYHHMPLFLYNSLHRKKELFVPIKPGEVRMYSCGPTVYGPAHIGNMRAYIFTDVLKRTIEHTGLKVIHAMNITDVGHLVGDSDEGQDKLDERAKKEGIHPLSVAQKYETIFWHDFKLLNCQIPNKVTRATESIEAQIELIKQLESKGFMYKTQQAIYFDTSRVSDYGKLTGQKLEDKKVGARADVVIDSDKRSPTDFAVWFFLTGRYSNHILHWPTPWGEGFPGWHVECSAISRQELGQPFDIHTGGVDHIGTHHTNEIAQSEAAYGEPLAHIWMHNEHLLVDESKMSKSLGNLLTFDDLIGKGFDPLDFRYLCLMAHYRTKMNFTWESLTAARNTRLKIEKLLRTPDDRIESTGKPDIKFYDGFLEDDLNIPGLLGALHQVNDRGLWRTYDDILGLGFVDIFTQASEESEDCAEIYDLFAKYKQARQAKDFVTSDSIRTELDKQGWEIRDLVSDSLLYKK